MCQNSASPVNLRRVLLRFADFTTLSNGCVLNCRDSQKEAEYPPFWGGKWPV